MKTYLELHQEISKEELFEGLLGHGLFADKIPNFLTSESFFDYIQEQSTFPFNEKKPTEYIQYSNTRNMNVPRLLSIPAPFSYANQVFVLSENWERILKYLDKKTKKQTNKVSRIHIRKLFDKKRLFEMNYKNFNSDGDADGSIFIKNKYVVHADISTCYPSIYSHSMAWALLGKNKAKSTKNDKNNWANKIDFYTQNLKHGETNGLLIGPHSSNLISEIILTCIDYELIRKKYQLSEYKKLAKKNNIEW